MAEIAKVRRKLLLTSVAVPLLPMTALSQEHNVSGTPLGSIGDSREAGDNHEGAMERLREIVGKGANPESQESLQKLVSHLISAKVVRKEDELESLVDLIFSKKSAKDLYDELSNISKAAKEKSDSVATSIKTIAASSAHWALKNLNEVDWNKVVYIVAADVFGALVGVITVLGKVPVPALATPAMVVGAVASAASSSYAAYYGSKGK